jgi:hypothetical protein
MAVVYVEARPKGKPEGSPIKDYVVEDHADHVLGRSTPNTRRLSGPRKMATRCTSLGYDISMIRKMQIIGARLDNFECGGCAFSLRSTMLYRRF